METPKRFIVVDDDPTNNILCTYAIRRIFPDMDVKTFENPEIALDAIKEEYSAADHNINTVLLLDVNMPEMTGWGFLEVFRNFPDHVHKQFSIYILTSSVSQNDKQISELTPLVFGFFTKPLSSDWIRDTFTEKPASTEPPTRTLPCYQITKNSLGVYRFKLLDKDEGKILIRSSDSFKTKDDCRRAIELCRQLIPTEKSYARLHHGRHFFSILSTENVAVAVSEMFPSSYAREQAIKVTKRDAATENVEDNVD